MEAIFAVDGQRFQASQPMSQQRSELSMDDAHDNRAATVGIVSPTRDPPISSCLVGDLRIIMPCRPGQENGCMEVVDHCECPEDRGR